MRKMLVAAASLLVAGPVFASPSGQTGQTPTSTPQHQSGTHNSGASTKVNHNTAENIRKAQQKLKETGRYAGAVSGRSNPQYERALQAFQKSKNLKQTGMLDEETVKALGI